MRIGLTLLLIIAMTGAGGYLAYSLLGPGADGPQTPAEQLMARNLYRPGQTELYHVADLQARPAVTAALGRLRAANICDLFFRNNTHKMTSDVKRVRLCGAPIDDIDAQRRVEYDFQLDELFTPVTPQPPPFAVFSDTDGAMYLLSRGKHGTVSADEMEQLVITVIDNAIAGLPAKIAQKTAHEASVAAEKAASDAAHKKAQESFK